MFKKIKAWWKEKMFDRDISNLFKEPPKRRERVTHFGYYTFTQGYNPICGKYKKGNHVSMDMKEVTCKKCRTIVLKEKVPDFFRGDVCALVRQ